MAVVSAESGISVRTEAFDPIEYIQNAFLDTRKADRIATLEPPARAVVPEEAPVAPEGAAATLSGGLARVNEPTPNRRFRKTNMSAPRPRRSRATAEPQIDPELRQVWETLPANIAFLCCYYDDSVTANYYRGEFKESRNDLVRRLLDPELSLEETARLLGVCPATVRRYTNRGWLSHHRTNGGQRRFRLSDLVRFVGTHGRFPEE